MSNSIETFGLSKAFRSLFRKTEAVHDLDMTVPEGSVYGLVGPNGAGKTTALKAVMNIHAPSSGHAQVLGVDSTRLGPDQLARIGYVSENQDLPDWMRLGYFLKYLKPFYPTWDDQFASDLVVQFQLPLHRKLGQMSRGMRVKAALASSLAYRPELLVLDEPFSGLDSLVRDELIEGLLSAVQGTTILISSHDLAEMESFSSHIGYLENGRLQFQEELTSLSSRFREIEVVLEGEPPNVPRWPETWLTPQSSSVVVRFVDSRFHPERTMAEVHKLFPSVRGVTVNAMPLRSIFVALARTGRKAA